MKRKNGTAGIVRIMVVLAACMPAVCSGNDEPAAVNTPPSAPAPATNAAPAQQTLARLSPGALCAVMRIECAMPDSSMANDVLTVCRDAGWVFETKVGCEPALGLKPIVIRKAPDGAPRACLNWLPREYGINLGTPDTRLYSQIVFQLAHEMGHVFINPYKGNWFTESMSTAMSYLVLDALAEKWKTSAPYDNWTSYAPNFASYLATETDARLQHYGLKSVEEAHAWVKTSLPGVIGKGDFDRPMQGVSAVVLRDIFWKHPNSWGVIVKLGDAFREDGSVDFSKWRGLVPPEHRPLVDAIAAEFTFPGVWPDKEKAAVPTL